MRVCYGRPSVVVMAQAEYESLIESLEILGDAQLMADLATRDEDACGTGRSCIGGAGDAHDGVHFN
jgi:hypothetical protein